MLNHGVRPYVGMARGKMATIVNVYTMICSKVCYTRSHKRL